MTSSNLEDQIEDYIFEHFNASQSAQHIFASYTESDVTKKLNDMASVQQAIESVLKQEVKKNYATFLSATEQIQQVGQEMTEFRQLIQNTQKLIADVHQNKISESRAMRTNSLLPSIQFQKAAEELRAEYDRKQNQEAQEKLKEESKLSIPEWLEKAPDELAEFIVEQQYQKAVTLVLKAKQFAEGSGASKLNDKVQDILHQINTRGSLLAATLKKSLLNLPNSPLWGMTEQYKRLKLLITLKEYAQAAEGFALIKEQNMLKAVQSVETSTDIIYYARELSRSFFHELYNSISLYHQLFTDQHQNENSEIVMLLVQWTQGQMSHYVLTLGKQSTLVVTESAMLWVIHLRDLGQWRMTTHAASFSTSGVPPSDEPLRPSLTPTKSGRARPRRQSILIPQAAVALNSGTTSNVATNSAVVGSASNSSNANSSSSVAAAIAQDQPLGGLFLLSKIINAAFQHAYEYQEKQQSFKSQSTPQSALNKALPMTSFLGFYMTPEINKMVAMYLEEFIREVSSQVRQDSWSVVRAPSLVVTSLIPQELQSAQYYGSGAYSSEDELVCLSYTWIISALDHLFADLSNLLNGDSNAANNYYSRIDISELEAVAAASLLRLLLRFIVELESIDSSTFSKVQQQCYANSLKAISQYLIPSMQRAMDGCFLVERLQLLATTPSNVFKTATLRLNRLVQEATSY